MHTWEKICPRAQGDRLSLPARIVGNEKNCNLLEMARRVPLLEVIHANITESVCDSPQFKQHAEMWDAAQKLAKENEARLQGLEETGQIGGPGNSLLFVHL